MNIPQFYQDSTATSTNPSTLAVFPVFFQHFCSVFVLALLKHVHFEGWSNLLHILHQRISANTPNVGMVLERLLLSVSDATGVSQAIMQTRTVRQQANGQRELGLFTKIVWESMHKKKQKTKNKVYLRTPQSLLISTLPLSPRILTAILCP